MRTIYLHTEPWLYRLLLISFFLPHKPQTFIFIFAALWVLVQAILQRINLSRKAWLMAGLLGGGYLFYLLWLPVTPSVLRPIVYSLLETKIALFVFPVIMAFAQSVGTSNWRSELPYFVWANAIHGLVVNVYLWLGAAAFGSHHVYYRINFENACGIHPTYYGLYICFSIAVLLYDARIKKMHGVLLCTVHLLLNFCLVLLSPKISLLIVLLIYVIYFLFGLHWKVQQKLLLMGSGMLLSLAFYRLLPSFHQRIGEVMQYVGGTSANAIDNSIIFRHLILDIDLRLLREHWLWGLGPAGLQKMLDMAWLNIMQLTALPINSYNTHNEYLNQWLSFGIGGLLYFLFIFLLHLRNALRRHDKMYLCCIFILMATCLTENILSRQQGVLFAALLMSGFWWEKTQA